MSSVVFHRRTAGGIPYKLMEGYPKIQATRFTVTAQEKYIIAATNVEAFYSESFPTPRVREDATGRKRYRVIQPRSMPGADNLITMNVSFDVFEPGLPSDPFESDTLTQSNLQGLSGPRWLATYADCYVATIDYEIADDDHFEWTKQAGGQFLSAAGTKTSLTFIGVDSLNPSTPGNSVFLPPNKPQGAVPNRDITLPLLITRPTIEHTLSWKIVVDPDFEFFDDRLGKINHDLPEILDKPPINSVLFMGYTAKRLHIWDESRSKLTPWSMEFHLTQLQTTDTQLEAGADQDKTFYFGWNHVYSPQHNRWAYVTRDGHENKPMYDTFDLQDTFKHLPGVA
jgi:hypothetical protein